MLHRRRSLRYQYRALATRLTCNNSNSYVNRATYDRTVTRASENVEKDRRHSLPTQLLVHSWGMQFTSNVKLHPVPIGVD